MSNPKFQTRLPLLLAATLAAGMFIGQQLPHFNENVSLLSGQTDGRCRGTFDEILRYVQAKYVDTINVEQLKNEAIDHLLSELDPHSVYITPEELKSVQEDMSGEFEGIGVEFLIVDDTIQVVTPLSGGPSEAAGLLPGDKIVTISDTLVAGVKVSNEKIFRLLRGAKGSKVTVGIRRGQEPTLRAFTITRDLIPVKSVDVAYMLEDKTGYLKINRFSEQTYQEFMQAVRPMVEEKGMRNLVIDLRGNPGGYLEEATDLLSQFFPDGKLLVYTQGRTEERRDYKSNGRARFNLDNIAVLLDEGSASASEIVAGAVQDWDRGWVIGRRSFGKGLVQEQYPLHDGGALRLTVARYFTPSGRCIQRDYKNDKDYEHEPERRLKNGELSDASKLQLADTTKYYTGQGRVVYGGGGIMPDVFVPLDTSFASDYFYQVRQQVPQFATRWLENHDRTTLPQDMQAFVKNFQVSNEMFEALIAYAEKQGTPRQPGQIARARAELSLELKARIAKVLFHDEGFWRVVNDDDPAVEKAAQVLRSGEPVAKKR